mmetsp:Transcript_18138/g.22200  ORF Transcript_18138/g.22200 Transcript_18138/m.22200 type:complete len:98 (-) Transcript_18138:1296-1589(-)
MNNHRNITKQIRSALKSNDPYRLASIFTLSSIDLSTFFANNNNNSSNSNKLKMSKWEFCSSILEDLKSQMMSKAFSTTCLQTLTSSASLHHYPPFKT